METIINIVCEYFDISSKEIFLTNRSREIIKPRQILFYLLRKHTVMSLNDIGKMTCFYGREKKLHHATISHAVGIVRTDRELYKDIKETVDYLDRKISISSGDIDLLQIALNNTYELSA